MKIRQLLDDLSRAQTIREKFQYVLNSDSHPTDAGIAAALLWVICDSSRAFHDYLSNSAAITLMLPRIATTSLIMCPSIIFGNA
jgi:hypothetical protein